MHKPGQNHVAGFLLSLTAAILWGVIPIAIKELLAGMDASTIVWYRFMAAGLALLVWLTVTKKLPKVATLNKQTIVFLLLATLGLSSNYFFFSYSLCFSEFNIV